jgi:hypothetical protein
LFGLGSCLRRSTSTLYRSLDGETEEIGRLGIPALAALRQGPRGGEAASVRRAAAARSATGQRQGARKSVGISAKTMLPNTIGTGIVLEASLQEAARRTAEEESEAKLPSVGAVEVGGRATEPKPR